MKEKGLQETSNYYVVSQKIDFLRPGFVITFLDTPTKATSAYWFGQNKILNYSGITGSTTLIQTIPQSLKRILGVFFHGKRKF